MDDSLRSLAEALAGGLLESAEAVGGGGNSRLYRVSSAGGRVFAFKLYPRSGHDRRDRLGAEFKALSFLRRQGVGVVPEALAADPAGGAALYQWIDGLPVGAPRPADIDAALAFAGRLRDLAGAEEAADLPLASEACLSAAEILVQIDRRRARLAEVAEMQPVLAEFLDASFSSVLERATAAARTGYARRDWAFDLPLPRSRQVLSPSDFGFHNALRRPDGSLVFIDFEYFGWDDPVKLVADFLQHPGMPLDAGLAARFAAGSSRLYGGDPGFADRLRLLFPLIGLRWCLILLNEFLPERWQARQFAGQAGDWAAVQRRQLDKARHRLAAVTLTLADSGQ